jgi:asparagine synthase (glutamine-hydrolysing)
MARRFIIFLWGAGDAQAERLALRHLEHLEAGDTWRRLFTDSGWAVALELRSSLRVRRLMHGRGVILGDLHPAEGQPAPGQRVILSAATRTSRQVFGGLSRRYWGRYVAVHQPAALEPASAFRDPSGALECLAWRQQRLTVVASHLPAERPALLGAQIDLRWDAVGRYLADPAAITAEVAFEGVQALGAGEMMRLDDFSRTTIWSPSRFVANGRQAPAVLHERLRQCVDQVVGAHALQANAILAEVSGGLDSAIVAGALQRVAPGKVAEWINFHTPDAEGDERPFARAVAAKLGLPLVEAAKSELRLTEPGLAVVGAGLRPSVAAVDYQYDEDNAARCVQLGADTLVTGQGGDAVFFQTRSALVAADALRCGLPPRALAAICRDAAAMGRVSIWSVARTALTAGLRRPASWSAPPYLGGALTARRSVELAHPWLRDLHDVPPAKQLQIHALAVAQLFHGHSRRGQVADLVHPLLSQPLVEFCLAVPSFDLALGSNDRALARAAFAEQVPQEVLTRRSKGDLTAYYGRMLARSLDVVRPYLLDGLLAREGLISRTYLEGALTAENLLWRDLASGLIELLAVEAWARHWSAVLRTARPLLAERRRG